MAEKASVLFGPNYVKELDGLLVDHEDDSDVGADTAQPRYRAFVKPGQGARRR